MSDLDYFADLYRERDDPWDLGTSEYEHRKHRLTVACLPRTRYRHGFEPACANGALTRLVARRCDALVASDPIAAPLQRARRDVPDAHVQFVQEAVPQDWPEGAFDLIVLSEIVYYLQSDARAECLRLTAASLAPGGHVVAVHYRPEFAEAACSAEQAHRELAAVVGWRRVVTHREDDFLLDLFEKLPADHS